MEMVFCRGCGKEIHVSAQTCPHCGAPQGVQQSHLRSDDIPDGVKGWSWGAFLLNGIWAIGNRTWIGLLSFVPYIGFVMAIVLGIKGREWAWKNKHWDSVEHFNRVQKKWSFWGVMIMVISLVIGVAGAVGIVAYGDYQRRAQEVAMQQAEAERIAQEQAELELQQKAEEEQRAKEAEEQKAAELQAAALAGQGLAGWEPAFKEAVFNGCVQSSGHSGESQASNGCKCIVDKASLAIPQARMTQIDSDPEVRSTIQEIRATCS